MSNRSIDFAKEGYYRFAGVDCQSYFLMKAGIKPVIRISDAQNHLKKYQKIWSSLGFYFLIKRFEFDPLWPADEPLFCGYLSSRQGFIRKAHEAERANDKKSLGELLGYPSCCIQGFVENHRHGFRDAIISAFLKTRNKASFFCNCLFNFESKIGVSQKAIYSKNQEMWQPYRHLFLIRHIPCSFDCAKSVKIGRYTLQVLKKEIPSLSEEIVAALKRPVLYFGYFNWLIFDGKIEEKGRRQLTYNRILPFQSLFPKTAAARIKRGNRLIIGNEKISIFRNKGLIAEIKKENKYKGVLIDFY